MAGSHSPRCDPSQGAQADMFCAGLGAGQTCGPEGFCECQTAADCKADNGAFNTGNYACNGGSCEYTGCKTDAECATGQSCGFTQGCDTPGVCGPPKMCTKDLVPYCGCDGTEFRGSSTCPARAFRHRGKC